MGESKIPREVPKGNVHQIDSMPPELLEHRDRIRLMMDARCKQEDSPIPHKLAMKAADFIMALTMVRGRVRMIKGKKAFPDAQTLANDIARSAESVETIFVVMVEEAIETLEGLPSLLLADTPRSKVAEAAADSVRSGSASILGSGLIVPK